LASEILRTGSAANSVCTPAISTGFVDRKADRSTFGGLMIDTGGSGGAETVSSFALGVCFGGGSPLACLLFTVCEFGAAPVNLSSIIGLFSCVD
jgi:hypothetical protein